MTMKMVKTGILLSCCAMLFAAAAAEAPSLPQIRRALAKLPPRGRLFVDFANWTPDRARDCFAFEPGRIITMRNADYLLTQPPARYELEGKRLLAVSNAVLERTLTLAFAWKLTGEEKYARRAVQEVLNAAAFPDWNPKHFLDAATMSMGVAIGYDFLYDFFTPDERRTLVAAMVEKGLKPSGVVTNGWQHGTNNWTQVCYAGLTAAALVSAEADPELCAGLIHRAVTNVPKVMKISYSPNGGYPEGPNYWHYGTGFNSFLIAMFKHAFGTDYGLSDIPGWSTTGVYYSHALTPAGNTYHYGDGKNECVPSFANFYLASQYPSRLFFCPKSRERLLWYSRQKPKDGKIVDAKYIQLSMLFMNRDTGNAPPPPPWYWSGEKATLPIFMCRSDWSKDALYLGIKGGSAKLSHAHLDAGSFVIESQGVYFVQELGNERYINIEKLGLDLWGQQQTSDRWKLFRYGMYGHSVIRIEDDQQLVDGFATLRNVKNHPDGSYTLDVELSSLYAGAKSVKRAVDFNPGRIRIADTLTGLKPGAKVTFQFCTRTDVADAENGLLLSRKNRTMRVSGTLSGGGKIQWQQLPADRFRKDYEAPDADAKVVWFETVAPASGTVAYFVDFTPGK